MYCIMDSSGSCFSQMIFNSSDKKNKRSLIQVLVLSCILAADTLKFYTVL